MFHIWNEMLVSGDERVIEPRSRIWASELGKSHVDIWLALKGIQPTNPPNLRSRRKFMAGNFWEWFFVRMMHVAGIFQSSQDYIKVELPDLLPVTGKLDIKAGGKPDYVKARESIKAFFEGDDSNFGIRLKNTMLAIVNHFETTFGDKSLKDLVIEVKSCSSFMFDHYERTGKANPNHVLQAFHYLKGTGMEEAHVFYVCKDDCRVMEFGVYNPSPVEDEYKEFIAEVTNFYKSDTQPPLAPLVVFDMETAKFSKNWQVEYSMYLKHLYGFEDPEHYREVWDREVASINRVFKRCVDGANMTKLNLEVIEKTKATLFPQWDELVAHGKKLKEEGKLQEEVSNDEENNA